MRINIFGGEEAENSTMALIFASAFVLIGVVMAGYGFIQYQGQAEYIDNPDNISATVSDNNIRTDSSRRGGTDYQAEITFEYSYEGNEYSSGFIHPLDDDKEFDTESKAEEFLENYAEGERVEAYVNSKSPEEAFLIASRSDQPLLLMIIGVMMVLAGGYKSVQRAV